MKFYNANKFFKRKNINFFNLDITYKQNGDAC